MRVHSVMLAACVYWVGTPREVPAAVPDRPAASVQEAQAADLEPVPPQPVSPPAAEDLDPEIERATRAVASALRCPTCQGLSIQDSPTEMAREMRAVIREQLEAGRSPQEVKEYFVDRYGEWVLLQPDPRGFNLLVYVLPLAALSGGFLIVGIALRRWTRAAGRKGAPPGGAHGGEAP